MRQSLRACDTVRGIRFFDGESEDRVAVPVARVCFQTMRALLVSAGMIRNVA